MKITADCLSVWEIWLKLTRQRCHMHYALEGDDILSHIVICSRAAQTKMEQLITDLPESFQPRRILEVGASVGFNSLALAALYPSAEVYSIEPDAEAVRVASCMAADRGVSYTPCKGVGEALPFSDASFDLIICHTVIEHVNDVELVIAEMTRVMSDDGIIHLEAPNYLWPHEPHLDIWCLPILGKAGVRLAAKFQGKSAEGWFVDHLQFVTPFQLTAIFNNNGLSWDNRFRKKIGDALAGRADIKHYTLLARLLFICEKLKIGRFIAAAAVRSGIYPSVLYTVYKSESGMK